MTYGGLASYDNFVIWTPIKKGSGYVDKVPVNPSTGAPCDVHALTSQMSMDTALKWAAHSPAYNVGFVIAAHNPFWFLDIDHCGTDGQWSDVAQQLCAAFTGCFIEVSQSGTGLHIIGSGQPTEHTCKNRDYKLEFYSDKRFVALTGMGVVGDASHVPHRGLLDWLVASYFPPRANVHPTSAVWSHEPVAEYTGPTDDVELVRTMLASTSAGSTFGGKASVQALWDADEDVLSSMYPSVTDGLYDHSSADSALCAHLSFWTGKNCDRMDALFKQSALYRDKWDREDYKHNTIINAVNLSDRVYDKPRPSPLVVQPQMDALETKTGFQLLTAESQKTLFNGCVYIKATHRVFCKNGEMLKPAAFKAAYGGYIFSLDESNSKTTRDAFEAFTQSQVLSWPMADRLWFKPLLPGGALINEEGLKYLNMYVNIEVASTPGNVDRFHSLMSKLFPVQRDRDILLAYMAACVQHAGNKFQWAPVIQGMEGNGKSFLLNAVAHAVGLRYTHRVTASDLGNTFNAWVSGTLFGAVDEMYGGNKPEVLESIKKLITDDTIQITRKGVDQTTGDNCMNFMFATNSKTAVVKTNEDRRFCIFLTPQQTLEDLYLCGLNGAYFYDLQNWARNEGGFAMITHFLQNYPIPDDLNPAKGCVRAPVTSTTPEAITATRTYIHAGIIEAIEEGRPGFRNGWASSMAVNVVFKPTWGATNMSQLMALIGYVRHPGLKNGRCTTESIIDGGKPILFIRKGHIHTNLTNPQEILRHYVEAQTIRTTS